MPSATIWSVMAISISATLKVVGFVGIVPPVTLPLASFELVQCLAIVFRQVVLDITVMMDKCRQDIAFSMDIQ